MRFAKIGAVSYVLWGLLHVVAALQEFSAGASLEPGFIQGKIYQGSWDLLFFALAAMVIAIRLNWRNDTLGYWLNLLIVSIADIGFLIFVLIPGYVELFPGILGPVFWVLGAIFTTIGFRMKPTH